MKTVFVTTSHPTADCSRFLPLQWEMLDRRCFTAYYIGRLGGMVSRGYDEKFRPITRRCRKVEQLEAKKRTSFFAKVITCLS